MMMELTGFALDKGFIYNVCWPACVREIPLPLEVDI
jgi:hypothetical protein